MHELYDLKEMLCNTLKEYSKKAEINTQSLDIVDKLAHAIKNLDKIIENYEAGGESHREWSYRYDGGNGGRSYAHDRRYTRRDRMGRYSGEDRPAERMVEELREMMQEAPDEKTRQEFQRFISKIEAM